jgi:sugar/nucleoside kinase (ribokinase family)
MSGTRRKGGRGGTEGPVDVVGIGLATLDVLIRLETMPTWERGAGFEDLALDGGGPVGTALVTVSRLGLRAGYVGTAGDDELAQRKLQSFTDDDVDISQVVVRPGPEQQIIVCYVHSGTGERRFSGHKRFGRGALTAEELDREYITKASVLHIDGYHGEAALEAARWMKAAGRTVVYDAHQGRREITEHLRQLIEQVDVLISGSGFFRSFSGTSDMRGAGEAILAAGPRIAVETDGANGSYTVVDGDAFHTPAFRVEVVDTTGAGDVFHGAYIVALVRGWSPRECAVFASAASALKCMKLGGRRGIPRFGDVEAFLREQGVSLPPKG